MVLLDTSFLIDLLNGKDDALALVRTFPAKVYISTIVLAEIELGFLRGKKDQKFVDNLIAQIVQQGIELISVDYSIASEYAKLQSNLMNEGQTIAQFDGLIAATAIVHNLQLVTQDNDFKRIKGVKLYNS